ncbi:HLA class II histocompatibility antigen, DM beta chain-like [Egretta garzetta]|uniref:HLA class II histocompatibility antigen, DM beta chain-like n=1 Tax=Egretta garzetta TaxID=188379 RepID=UPI00163C6C03|nr:HLA class II histocompatibility antigen, DM beta chain-like [Egretta garzetta]
MTTGMLPESKGVPVANIFPLQPLALGQPNTLVCMVENIFPPAVEISWQLNEMPVTEGVTQTHYTPTADLAFVRFSYLLTEPAEGDRYACIITREGDNSSVITYWVPQTRAPSEVLRRRSHTVAGQVASVLNNGTAWAQRAEARRQACRDLGPRFWASTALRRTPPQVRIVPVPLPNAPDAVLLTCHIWGFYPPEVTVLWLHNGDMVATGDTAKVLPNGDWTYQTQVTLMVTAKAGDTFTCSVHHASLDLPLQEHWGPGLSPGLTVKVAVAAGLVTLGLVVFAAGTFSYCRQAPGEGHMWGHTCVAIGGRSGGHSTHLNQGCP